MTKKNETLVVPLRADIPIGTRFKFAGCRNVYEITESPETFCCALCAFQSRRRRLECNSVFCTPKFRNDGKYVYAKRVN